MKLNCIGCTILLAWLILTSGCTDATKFKVGDCLKFVIQDAERWQKDIYSIERIEEVGKFQYRTSMFYAGHWWPTKFGVYFSSTSYVKVECPKS